MAVKTAGDALAYTRTTPVGPGKPQVTAPAQDRTGRRVGADPGSDRNLLVDGELFFASSNDLYTQFEYALYPDYVVIDMHASHRWDASTMLRWTPSPRNTTTTART
jgi:MFS superfamily sulfate permease-like transporter